MTFFNFTKKNTKEVNKGNLVKSGAENCCDVSRFTLSAMNETQLLNNHGSSVKVLGSGCDKCKKLEVSVVNALKELGIDTSIDHVTDFAQIASYGIMTTPALVVNGKVVSYGKVLSVPEIVDILKNSDLE